MKPVTNAPTFDCVIDVHTNRHARQGSMEAQIFVDGLILEEAIRAELQRRSISHNKIVVSLKEPGCGYEGHSALVLEFTVSAEDADLVHLILPLLGLVNKMYDTRRDYMTNRLLKLKRA